MNRHESYWDRYESQANNFAADLLMPEKLIRSIGQKTINEYMEKHNAKMPLDDFISTMAVHFHVSNPAMTYRLRSFGVAKKELPKRTRHAPPACLYSIQIEYARSDTANSSQAYNQPLLQFELRPPPHRASPDHLPSPQPNHPERFVFRQRCEPASGAVDRSVESHGPLSPSLEIRRIRWIVRHGGSEGLRVEGNSCLIFLIYNPFFQRYS